MAAWPTVAVWHPPATRDWILYPAAAGSAREVSGHRRRRRSRNNSRTSGEISPDPRVRAIILRRGARYGITTWAPAGHRVLAIRRQYRVHRRNGRLVALDAKTGERLWSVDVGQNKCDGVCLEASAMTYMVGGKQYIAMSGYGKLIGYSLAPEGQILTTATGVRQTASAGAEEVLVAGGPWEECSDARLYHLS